MGNALPYPVKLHSNPLQVTKKIEKQLIFSTLVPSENNKYTVACF